MAFTSLTVDKVTASSAQRELATRVREQQTWMLVSAPMGTTSIMSLRNVIHVPRGIGARGL